MMPFKLSEEEQRLLIITVGCVILFFFFQFILSPKLAQTRGVKEELKAKRLQLKVAEQKIKALLAIEKNLGAVTIRSELPREAKALAVLRLISQAANKSGLNLTLIKPLPDNNVEGIKFSLDCSGSYQELYNFLAILFRLPIVVMTDILEISSAGGTKPELNVKIALTAYY